MKYTRLILILLREISFFFPFSSNKFGSKKQLFEEDFGRLITILTIHINL